MLRSLALLAVSGAAFPVPPLQTETQKQQFQEKKAAAKKASDAATADVLAFFGSAGFRKAMEECCPAVAKMSAQEVLDRYRAEVRAAELAHTFPVLHHAGFPDFSIDSAMAQPWFVNLDQAAMLAGYSGVRTQDAIEEKIYGCTPFAEAGKPTWDEASSRLIYIANNFRQFDFASEPLFGDATAIFDTEHVKDMVLISPMDTGNYWNQCHAGQPGQPGQPGDFTNCSAWQPETVGTLDHLDHLILPNLHFFYSDVFEGAKELFSHSAFAGSYASRTVESSALTFQYFEANLLGNPRLEGGVKFLIASFPKLFGREEGRKLQELAAHFSWPLVWAWGFGAVEERTVGNRRFLDPSAAKATNASLPASASGEFEAVWSEAAAFRNSTKQQGLEAFWEKLAKQVFVAPLASDSCADSSCVATVLESGDCVCDAARASLLI